jgi:hypothetical protein
MQAVSGLRCRFYDLIVHLEERGYAPVHYAAHFGAAS